MMNVATRSARSTSRMLPNAGIGLARLELIIASHIGVHPKALLEYPSRTPDLKKIDERIAGYADPGEFYVDRSPKASPRSPRVLAEAGDRAPVGLQVQRVRRTCSAARATSRTKRTR
jgi:phosphoenolpyruvate synthase/pyruvate phosphate dikinase